MKVLTVNSSARVGQNSKTELMLNQLIEGMQAAGAEKESINLKDHQINYCIGCYTCWTKTPGKCVHRDDMANTLFPQWLAADLVVYATPLFHRNMNANMKTFLERTLPNLEPDLVFQEESGRWTHPLRQSFPATVWLSVCGFPAQNEFDALKANLDLLHGENNKLWGTIFRSGAEYLPNAGPAGEDVLAAAREAGRELITQRQISAATMARLTQPLMDDIELFARMANIFWRSCIAEGVTPRQFAKQRLMPRPAGIEEFVLMLPMGFNPEGAGDTAATLQFEFSGEIEGTCHFVIAEQTMKGHVGRADKPDLTILVPFEIWFEVMTHKREGQQVFMEQLAKAKGDLGLLMRMGSLFK